MLGFQTVENDLAEAVRAQRDGGVPKKGRGALFAIDGAATAPLAVGSARADTRGINLLSLKRRTGALSNEGDTAVLFAKPTSVRSLRRSIERYADWVDEGDEDLDEFIDEEEDERSGRRPRNFWLLESAAAIRPATLFDFWTDEPEKFPEPGVRSQWEVWTRKGYEESFAASVRDLNLQEAGRRSEFIEVYIRNFVGTPEEVLSLVRGSAAVVQLRSASSFVGDFIRMDDSRRQRAVDAIASRIVLPSADAPRVAILDTGVDRTNPLLTGSLPIDRQYAAETVWNVDDHDGHGTKMAGVAQFGDLSTLADAREPILLSTSLESVVVSPSDQHAPLPARDALERAVELVEAEVAIRVFCLAQTAVGENEDGRPSSTAAMLDRLAYNDGQGTRLFCAAVGNVPHSDNSPYRFLGYENRNHEYRTQAPAQAVNALSVGAVASKTSPAQNLVAPFGDLAPTSRTSQGWMGAGSYKPDIVMEGGNFVKVGNSPYSRPSAEHLVLTTGRRDDGRLLSMTGETSAATAMASGLAARTLARYPRYRMETIRALMVHSADWTPAMLAEHQRLVAAGTDSREAYRTMLHRYGWGIPDEGRLATSSDNGLTLVIEDTLTPYAMKADGSIRLREMKYFELPWPRRVLRDLGTTQVEMRCTLSYFAEPDPHAVSRDRLDRYASHRLRFDVKRTDENHAAARARVNMLESVDTGRAAADDGWLLGARFAKRGTIHHDIWRGAAYDLALRDGISITPVRGWWGDMRQLDRYARRTHFSLVVSIRIPSGRGDLFVEAAANAPRANLVEEPIPVTT